MLNGLEAVDLKLSEVLHDNEDFRCDSEYFRKANLEKLNTLERIGFDYVNNFAFVTDGIHESINFDEESEINLISAKSPKENTFDLTSNYRISEAQHLKNPRTALRVGDVIVSSVGTIGNCAVVDESILPANSDRHVGIIRIKEKYLPHFVSTFLVSKYGRFQTFRESTGNVQLNLFVYKIRKLKVANLSFEFQSQIEATVKAAHRKLEQSKALYAEAENLLLDELGLTDWQPSQESVAVKSFAESFLLTGRLDAEFYQPKYDELLKQLRKVNARDEWRLTRLGSLSSPLRYGTSAKLEYLKSGTPFLRIADVTQYRFHLDNLKRVSEAATEAESFAQVKTGDVIISRSGTLGLAVAITKELNGAIFGSYFIRVRPQIENLNADYLALYINALVGKMQVEQANTGGIQTNLTVPAIEDLQIVLPPVEVQQQLANKVLESFKVQDESKQLLELAKRAVEMAIEHDEQAALAWMNQQI